VRFSDSGYNFLKGCRHEYAIKISLAVLARKEIGQHCGMGSWMIVALEREFRISWPTIYKVSDRAQKQGLTS